MLTPSSKPRLNFSSEPEMSTEVMMPALSPTMEKGTLAKWLVKEGDRVRSGTILAEIETDKATMEFEAVDDGSIVKIIVPEGTDNVLVGTVIAIIGESEESAVEDAAPGRSEEHTSELQSLMRISYAVFCLKKKKNQLRKEKKTR